MTINIAPVTDENPRATIGGNRAPIAEALKDAVADLPERLQVEFADIKKRSEELLAAFKRCPAIVTDATAGMIADQIAQIAAHTKEAEAFRTAAVAPVLKAQRQINGWFDKNCFDELDVDKSTTAAKQVLAIRLTKYQVDKKNEETRRREEEAYLAAERAAEAERVARLESERVERERLASEEAAREREARIQNEKDLKKALELEEENKRLNAEREAQAKIAAEKAEAARIEADKAAQSAAARPSEMTVARGDFGSSASLRGTWKARRTNKNVLVDLNGLREFITADVIEKAANAHARTYKNTKPVVGLEFYEDFKTAVRG